MSNFTAIISSDKDGDKIISLSQPDKPINFWHIGGKAQSISGDFELDPMFLTDENGNITQILEMSLIPKRKL